MRSLQLTVVVGVIAVAGLASADATPTRDSRETPAVPHAREADPVLAAGWRAYRQGKTAEALRAYRQVLETSPTDASLWYDLGCLYAIEHDPSSARAALRRSLELDPRLADAYDVLGQLAERDDALETAHAFYASADALRPGHAKTLRHLVRILLRLEQPGPARQALRDLVALVPDDVEARYRLGVLELRADAPDAALHEFQMILERSPNHVRAWNGAALAYAHIGAFEDAAKALGRAKELDQDGPDTQTNAGVIAAYQQHWEEARAVWRQTLERHPQFAPAAKNLQALEAHLEAPQQ